MCRLRCAFDGNAARTARGCDVAEARPRTGDRRLSKLNACTYCVAHHTPFLVVEGVSPTGVEHILDYRDHPEFDDRDKLVVEYAIAAWERPNRIPDALFTRLRQHFSEAQLVELTLRITLCGFFNKFNDALGIEEEPEAVERFGALTASAR